LIQNIDGMGLDNPFTSLVWPLKDDDPDDAFSRVPYDKVQFASPFFVTSNHQFSGFQFIKLSGIQYCWY
jgi:hypothetical protein